MQQASMIGIVNMAYLGQNVELTTIKGGPHTLFCGKLYTGDVGRGVVYLQNAVKRTAGMPDEVFKNEYVSFNASSITSVRYLATMPPPPPVTVPDPEPEPEPVPVPQPAPLAQPAPAPEPAPEPETQPEAAAAGAAAETTTGAAAQAAAASASPARRGYRRRPHPQNYNSNNKATFGELKFDSTRDFDFENANAEFAKRLEASAHGEGGAEAAPDAAPAYSSDNFFDSLTPDGATRHWHSHRGRGRGRGGYGYRGYSGPRRYYSHSDDRAAGAAPEDGSAPHPHDGGYRRGRGGRGRGRGYGRGRGNGAPSVPPSSEPAAQPPAADGQ